MQVLCINLARASDRRAAMIEQFRRLGMEFEIFSATDWQDLDEADFALVDAETRRRQGRRPLSDGMIACALSHRRAPSLHDCQRLRKSRHFRGRRNSRP